MTGYALNPAEERTVGAHSWLAVKIWLYAMAALVFAMIIVGGATRLTDSGLSITEWKPLLGAIPPLSEAAWQEAFDKYRQIPQYQLVNKGMSLEAFKFIFWWEWAHRFLGRFIGLAFLAPFVFFLASGRIKPAEAPKFLALFALGGLQGALGWYMVQSGLVDRVDVSQYRLAAHLGLAAIIFGAILWVATGIDVKTRHSAAAPGWAAISAAGFILLLFVQIAAGAFVAGLDAGKAHNTWPLMDGAFIPGTVGALSPLWRDIFENVSTVQFNHRLLAYALVGWGLVHAAAILRSGALRPVKLTAGVIGAAVLAQTALGIWTVLAAVPLWLGLAHQGGAMALLAAAIIHLRLLTRPGFQGLHAG